MKFGLVVTPGAHACAIIRKAEDYGFDSAFVVDSPTLFGDPYVTLGAAAAQTRRILLGIAVTNPLSRSEAITASSFASLNALAPGRIALGIGVGYTANLTMGQRNATLRELKEYIEGLRRLFRGEVAEFDVSGHHLIAQFLNGLPWINIADRIPIYVAAAGPKSLTQAGEIADAIILGGITNIDIIEACKGFIRTGAVRVGRRVEDLELAITPAAYVTDTEPTFEHLREVLGPKSMGPAVTFSRLAEAAPTVPREVTQDLVKIRVDGYAPEPVDGQDPRTRHLRAYRGYLIKLQSWQEPMITRNVLDATSIAGTVEQCCEKIRLLGRHGVGHIIMNPLPQHLEATIEIYGREVLPQIKSSAAQ